MLQNIKKTRGGFTLVEIMIVVAIIALLAAIAVPNFMRARARSQATTILEEARIIDAAQEQYAIENSAKKGDTVAWTKLTPYLKAGSRLAQTTDGSDIFGNAYGFGTVGTQVTVNSTTASSFDTAVVPTTFWGAYYAAPATTTP